MRVHQKQVGLLRIQEQGNIYFSYGWDHYNGRSHWGKWLTNSVRFRMKDPGLFRFPVIHIWRSFQLCLDHCKGGRNNE